MRQLYLVDPLLFCAHPDQYRLVCSGVPLEKVPQIRRFYGKSDSDKTSPIDFLKDLYVYPDRHVIASRITAENPDDGFKPTSGKIERIKFQSSVACWGYFSIGAKGGIHEYADSQFGHIFAHGANREEARKALMLSLKLGRFALPFKLFSRGGLGLALPILCQGRTSRSWVRFATRWSTSWSCFSKRPTSTTRLTLHGWTA